MNGWSAIKTSHVDAARAHIRDAEQAAEKAKPNEHNEASERSMVLAFAHAMIAIAIPADLDAMPDGFSRG